MQVCYPSYPELTPLEDLRLAVFYFCLLLSDADWSSPISDFLLTSVISNFFATSDVVNSLTQGTRNEVQTQKNENIGHDMEAILSLDDGRWSQPEEDIPSAIIRQPVPPPVLAQVQPEVRPISPSRVADPRPGPAKSSEDGIRNSYQHLHIVSLSSNSIPHGFGLVHSVSGCILPVYSLVKK